MKRIILLAASSIMGIMLLGGCEDDNSKETSKTNKETTNQEVQVETEGNNKANDIVTNENSGTKGTAPITDTTEENNVAKPVSEFETDESLFTDKELKQLPTVREAAYKHLSYVDVLSLTRDYKEAKVTIAKSIDIPELLISEDELDVTDVYLVVLPSEDDSILGPFEIYVHPYTFTVIGQGIRE